MKKKLQVLLGAIILAIAVWRPPSGQACDIDSATPWIEKWLAAWDFTSTKILHLPDAPAPQIVLYDSTCVYTTSPLTAHGAPAVDGPALRGTPLKWRAIAHGDTLTLPDSSKVPVALMSFTKGAPATGPFFVMAAPSYWATHVKGPNDGYFGVFLHEFAHTRQLAGMRSKLGPIDDHWSDPEELDDDVVQKHFQSDSVYVAAYLAERDLLYQAAAADSLTEVRATARQALAMMRARHARWLSGDKAVFTALDDIFLSLEGVGQFVAVAWLSHPDGGGMTRDAAVKKMLGRRRWWVQDEGLAILLVVDRLMPDWPKLAFSDDSPGATDLLAKAVGE